MRFCLLIVVLLICKSLASHTWAQEHPNVLVILADDLGYGDVNCYNAESKVPTPNLDQLALDGMRFTDAHSPSTVCTPSRYSLLTGRMCFRTGLRSVFTGVDGPLIEPGRLTLAQFLHDEGYATACVGKWHIGMTFFDDTGAPVKARGGGLEKVKQVDFSRAIEDGPCDLGFDYFFGTVCCPTTDFLYAYIENDRLVEMPTEIAEPQTKHWLEYEHHRRGLKAPGFDFRKVDLEFLDKSIAFLENHVKESPDQPFFLYHSTQTAHLPAMPAEQFVGETDAGPYGDFVFEFDYVTGELLNKLEELGLSENTLVIVSSDNGPEIIATEVEEQFGHDSARPWRGLKRDNWEGGHRVPLIVRWPKHVEAGAETDTMVCLTDIFATVADIVEKPIPNEFAEDSISFRPALADNGESKELRSFLIHQTNRNALAIRIGKWKWLDHTGSGGNNYDQPRLIDRVIEDDPEATGQLYDIEADPGETVNLWREHPEVVERLKNRLEEIKSSGRSVNRSLKE